MADRYQDRPFPADNYRGGNQAPSKGESDPLAELARLIGQTDPFAGLGGRANQQAQPRGSAREQFQPQPQLRPQPRPQPALEPDDAPAGPPSWIQRAAAQQPHDLDADPHPGQRFAPEPPDRQAPQFAPEQQAPPQPAPPFAPQQQAPQFSPQQAPQFAPQQQAPQFAPQQAPQFSPQQQAPQFAPQQQAPQQQAPSFSADPHQRGVDPERYDEALYGQLPGASRDMLQEAEFDDPYAYQDEYGEGMVDQERPRRGGMFTVAVVLALAVVGTGAAFAYRAYVGSERNGDPPIIRADTGPNKMIPPTQSGDASGKLIQDRMTGGTERLVSREEQPVDLRDGKSGPRVIYQGANPPPAPSALPLNRPVANAGSSMSASTGTGIAANAAMAANTSNSLPAAASSTSAIGGNGTVGGDEPRKIRTVSVRGDQTDAAGNAAAKSTATTRSVAPAAAPVRAQPVAVSANAPMSIAPQAGAAPADARTRVASTNAATPPVEPVAATGAGNFMVQVSSQGSEADAQSAYKSLQGKYPDQLGSREPMITQGDVHGKTVYRSMVGPFASSREANQFCNGLKTAGGQCFVPRN
jgi:hypothetical protein